MYDTIASTLLLITVLLLNSSTNRRLPSILTCGGFQLDMETTTEVGIFPPKICNSIRELFQPEACRRELRQHSAAEVGEMLDAALKHFGNVNWANSATEERSASQNEPLSATKLLDLAASEKKNFTSTSLSPYWDYRLDLRLNSLEASRIVQFVREALLSIRPNFIKDSRLTDAISNFTDTVLSRDVKYDSVKAWNSQQRAADLVESLGRDAFVHAALRLFLAASVEIKMEDEDTEFDRIQCANAERWLYWEETLEKCVSRVMPPLSNDNDINANINESRQLDNVNNFDFLKNDNFILKNDIAMINGVVINPTSEGFNQQSSNYSSDYDSIENDIKHKPSHKNQNEIINQWMSPNTTTRSMDFENISAQPSNISENFKNDETNSTDALRNVIIQPISVRTVINRSLENNNDIIFTTDNNTKLAIHMTIENTDTENKTVNSINAQFNSIGLDNSMKQTVSTFENDTKTITAITTTTPAATTTKLITTNLSTTDATTTTMDASTTTTEATIISTTANLNDNNFIKSMGSNNLETTTRNSSKKIITTNFIQPFSAHMSKRKKLKHANRHNNRKEHKKVRKHKKLRKEPKEFERKVSYDSATMRTVTRENKLKIAPSTAATVEASRQMTTNSYSNNWNGNKYRNSYNSDLNRMLSGKKSKYDKFDRKSLRKHSQPANTMKKSYANNVGFSSEKQMSGKYIFDSKYNFPEEKLRRADVRKNYLNANTDNQIRVDDNNNNINDNFNIKPYHSFSNDFFKNHSAPNDNFNKLSSINNVALKSKDGLLNARVNDVGAESENNLDSLLKYLKKPRLPKGTIRWKSRSAPIPLAYFTITVIQGALTRHKRPTTSAMKRRVSGTQIYATGLNMPTGYTQVTEGNQLRESSAVLIRILDPQTTGPFVEFKIRVLNKYGSTCRQMCLDGAQQRYHRCARKALRLSTYKKFSDPIPFYGSAADALDAQWTGRGYYRRRKYDYLLFRCD